MGHHDERSIREVSLHNYAALLGLCDVTCEDQLYTAVFP